MTSISERARARAGVTDHCPNCGLDLSQPKRGKPRSVPQHKRFFAMIRAAYAHWPESHRFQPMSEDHLRKWLQAKAGHHVVTTIDVVGIETNAAILLIAAGLSAAKDHTFTFAADGKFYIFQSKTIAFDTLPHLSACALFDAVADTIESETGLKVADIMPAISERKPTKAETCASVPL